jgi:Uma2 family endonuclease
MTLQELETPPTASLAKSLMRMNADQYHRMIEEGIIPEDSSTELLNGLIVRKDVADSEEDVMGHGPAHRLAVRLLIKLAVRIDSEARHFQVQLPIGLGTGNEPEPDGAIILGSDAQFADHLPTSNDVACVIEVAGSSLERDKTDKLPVYAAAGIQQYVIVNLRQGQIEIHTNPDASVHRYRSMETVSKGQAIKLNLGNGAWLEVRADDLMP